MQKSSERPARPAGRVECASGAGVRTAILHQLVGDFLRPHAGTGEAPERGAIRAVRRFARRLVTGSKTRHKLRLIERPSRRRIDRDPWYGHEEPRYCSATTRRSLAETFAAS